MNKILLIILSLIPFIIVTGCGNKVNFEFDFDHFYGYFFTNNTFEKREIVANGLGSKLIKNDIIQSYIQSNSTGYIDSIIVIKKITDKELKNFVNENKQRIKLEGYKSNSIKEGIIRCKDNKIEINTVNSQLTKNLNQTFFTHSFFKVENYIYIISYSTDNEDERDIFSSDVKNIKCK